MKKITDLPLEVTASIFRHLESLDDLGHCILACRHFHNTFKEYKDVPGTIVGSSWDPDLLSLAVATELVKGLPTDRSGLAVRDFVDGLVYDSKNMYRMLKTMSVPSLLSMMDMQDAIVDLAFDMAESSFREFDFNDYAIAYNEGGVGLSPAEATRFCRAFYRTQLYFEAFPNATEATVAEGSAWLASSFAMFEIEQMACVYDYLERLVLQISRYTLAKDHFFGHRKVNFLCVGAGQGWSVEDEGVASFVAQGMVWIASLLNFDQHDKISTLRDKLRKAHCDNLDHYSHLALAIVDLKGHLKIIKSQGLKEPRDDFDNDSGPPSAYDYANMDDVKESGDPFIVPHMPHWGRGMRERAYVLWDMSRMKDQDLFFQIEDSPDESSMEPTREEWWLTSKMENWHTFCQRPLETLKEVAPKLVGHLTGWEEAPVIENVARGNRLTTRKAWLSEHAAPVPEGKDYFVG